MLHIVKYYYFWLDKLSRFATGRFVTTITQNASYCQYNWLQSIDYHTNQTGVLLRYERKPYLLILLKNKVLSKFNRLIFSSYIGLRLKILKPTINEIYVKNRCQGHVNQPSTSSGCVSPRLYIGDVPYRRLSLSKSCLPSFTCGRKPWMRKKNT